MVGWLGWLRYTDPNSYTCRNTTTTRTCSWATNTAACLVFIKSGAQHSNRCPLLDPIMEYINCHGLSLLIRYICSIKHLARSITSGIVGIKFVQSYRTECDFHLLLAAIKLNSRHPAFVNSDFRVSFHGSGSRFRNGICHSATEFVSCFECNASYGIDIGLLHYSCSIRNSELFQCCAFVCCRYQHPS